MVFQADGAPYSGHRIIDESVHRVFEQRKPNCRLVDRHADDLATRYPLEIVYYLGSKLIESVVFNGPDNRDKEP